MLKTAGLHIKLFVEITQRLIFVYLAGSAQFLKLTPLLERF